MTNRDLAALAHADLEGDLASLRGDARRAPQRETPGADRTAPVPPSSIHGVSVPDRSARMLDAMSDYGD